MTANVDPSVYTDLQGLAKLRGQAREKSPEALREAAKQFEALFVQMMLKSMREAKLGDGLMDNDQSDMYREMYDKQIAMNLTRHNGLGLGDMLMKQLGGDAAATSGVPATATGLMPLHGAAPALNTLHMQRFSAAATLSALAVDGSVNGNDSELAGFPEPVAAPVSPECGAVRDVPVDLSSPEGFVQSVWPHAQQAARELGVDPKVLVAQAALETGWGKSVMQHADGSSSHNLFGIKASTGWQGQQVTVPTLEYSDGIPVRTRASFRAYGSFADSFSDYVDFLKSNPRYRQALAQVDDPQRFAGALQNAGYATDPAYARKISAIVNGDTLQSALAPVQAPANIAQVKPPSGWPLS